MKRYIVLFLALTSILASGQKNIEKKFDIEIFEYLSNTIDKESTSLEEFLVNSKPFSKWDMRPLATKKVEALDSIYTSSQIPNFIWGAFSTKYGLSEEESMSKPNKFLNEGVQNKSKLNDHFKLNIKNFNNLSHLIMESSDKIFLNQNTIQKIDAVFKENNIYWSYIIPKYSPYPISSKTKIKTNFKFSQQQNQILKLLNELNIYCAVKTSKGIFYLVDGFTDNSYGFYFNPKNQMEEDNLLFEIMKSEKIVDNYFYYVAN
ncbi:hypothetical protein [Chryseobacterium vrystaatense]|uniref:Uncharacterized protein n=1 Tax=Chryseobacterium vrystaatense TaxID=307480 RepID=A0ABR4UJM0_9FLAO|nr:hypothetical protein [Chryseobacterium vrystaatense]KFF24889.1 hypothetical protein IW16_18360 [Chryseobacterium vrystaatense]